MTKNNNIIRHHVIITRLHRERLNGHRSVCLWFTGISGTGKSTLAYEIEEGLYYMGCFDDDMGI